MNGTSAAFSLCLFRAARFLGGVCLIAVIPFALVKPAPAAERVTLTYGFAEISTSLQSLRDYAERGEVSSELAPYLDFLSEDQRSHLRSLLQARPNIGPVSISQLLYSSIGDNVLSALGDIVRTPSRRNGAQGLRSALVLAAAEPGGLSLLSVIDQFPGNTVRIDSPRLLQMLEEFSLLVKETQIAVAAIEQQASLTDFSGELSAVAIPDLVQSGPYGVTVELMTMIDEGRDGKAFLGNRTASHTKNRTLTVDLYLPESTAESQILSPVPLVVISHGLTDTRKSFDFMAEHLASHGFAVAALDHPGSDFTQFEALIQGFTDEITDTREFSDRPRDISFLLDELTRLNHNATSHLANRLDMEKIGIIGHSFGGYTALAIAGAQLNFGTLTADCHSTGHSTGHSTNYSTGHSTNYSTGHSTADSTEFTLSANPSMLLQCTALAAPEQFSENLQDDRIQAVMAMNPVTSSLFGPTGFSHIAVPTLLVAGSADPLAPALLEQIRPFTWLPPQVDATKNASGPSHYLALIEGGSHLYALPGLAPPDSSPGSSFVDRLVSPNIALSENYLNALSLGFMQMTLADNIDYQQVFTHRTINNLSQPDLPLHVINHLTEEMLMSPSELMGEPRRTQSGADSIQ